MRSHWPWMMLGTLMIGAGVAEAQQNPGDSTQNESKGRVLDLVFRVEDMVFRAEDMGGKVQTLDVKESATEVRIDLAADVLFDFDKSYLLPKAQQTLKQAAEIVREKAKGTVRIEGYTDSKGSELYNQKLSERRAAAVKSWFITKVSLRNVSFNSHGFGAKN